MHTLVVFGGISTVRIATKTFWTVVTMPYSAGGGSCLAPLVVCLFQRFTTPGRLSSQKKKMHVCTFDEVTKLLNP